MRVTLSDGRVFRIHFRHIFEHSHNGDQLLNEIETAMSLRPFRLVGATECWLTLVGEKPAEVSHGVAACCVDDEYDKEVGRKLALARALQVVFPKSDPTWKVNRLRFWDVYNNRQEAPSATSQPVEIPEATTVDAV